MSRLLGTTTAFAFAAGVLAASGAALAEDKPASPNDKPPAPAPAPAPKPMTAAEAQNQAWKTLVASAPAIDKCTDTYLAEYPTAQGQVTLNCLLTKDGAVSSAEAVTTLEGARNLRPCLEAVAKSWKLPPTGREGEKLGLTVQVKKGTKFTLLRPGEKPPEPKPGAPKDEGAFVRFLPPGWEAPAK